MTTMKPGAAQNEERIAALKAAHAKVLARKDAALKAAAERRAKPVDMSPEELRGREVRNDLLLVPPEDLIVIGIDCFGRVDENGNPRPHKKGEHVMWKESINDPINQSTVDTMKMPGIGIIEAVQARRINGRLVVNNGRGRTRHGRVANEQLRAEGKETLRVKVLVIQTDEIVSAGAAIIANAHRRTADVPEQAEELVLFLALGKTEEEAAVYFSVTLQTIKNWLLFLKAIPDAQIMAIERKIAASAVIDLARRDLSPEDQMKMVLLWKKTGVVSSTKARDQIRQKKDPSAISKPKLRDFKRFYAAVSDKDLKTGLSKDFILGVQWADGKVAAKEIDGLAAILKKSV